MEEYRESKSDFEKLEEITARVLKKIVDDCQILGKVFGVMRIFK